MRRASYTCQVLVAVLVLFFVTGLFGQETTASLQGVVKDPSGAVVPKASVEVSSPALIGNKKAETDSAGSFRFNNLPPGTYTVTVTATGFTTYKEGNVELAVGHLPSLEIDMHLGATTETVEVSGQAVLIDATQSKVQTNISELALQNLPTQSLSYQSVIQFAPGARSEPLQNSGTSANNGFQINGASNSENAYLVDGMDTGNILDGHSQANVPMDFIEQVQIKTSGFEAENGGALGGVVNVISKRGSNEWHGSVFMYYNADRFNAAPNPSQIKNPQFPANLGGTRLDQPVEYYYPIKDHSRIADPGFTLGGALIKDRLWVFAASQPDFNQVRRTVSSTYPGAVGARVFNDNNYTYYSFARLDARVSDKIRLYGSWQYNFERGTGTSLPGADSSAGQFNSAASTNPDNFNGGIGYVAPQSLYSAGADITINPTLVATTRFGYFYYNYEDRGLPVGIRYVYRDSNYPYSTGDAPALATTTALNGALLPSQYVNSTGYANIGANSGTAFDIWQRYNLSQDLAWFKNWHGTHNLKFGYAFNHNIANEESGIYNTADVYVAYGIPYVPQTTDGEARCVAIEAQNKSLYGQAGGNANGSQCQGLWGTMNIRDLISASGKVGNWNHSFYVQDAWSIGRGLTLNLGLRLDKENLPSYDTLPGFQGISFGWGQKIAPRLGAAYDVLHNGKLKIYGSFGDFYDIMKFNLPQGSFGGAYWHDCVYALDTANYNTIIPQRDSLGHYCPLGGGGTPAVGQIPNARLIENYDYREPANDPNQIGSLGPTGLVDPNLKPMKEHVYTVGAAWEISHNMMFEPIYTRTRLDKTIEDAGTITQNGEVYYITNPGFGVNTVVPNCNGCPPNPKAIRDYDGLELRLTKRFSDRWYGAFSYTYSRLYGNYDGLTSTDISDAEGRNGANSDRAFDEPFMQFDAHGKSDAGRLATDRPNTFKGNVYYQPKLGKFTPTLGLFQQIYQGTPLSSYISVWGAPVFVEGRGNFVNVSRDTATGNWIPSAVTAARTPNFVQSDISIFEDFHVSKTNEKMIARVGADCVNCFNQHKPVVINSNLIRTGGINPATCGTAGTNCTTTEVNQAGFDYGAMMTKGYDYIGLANSQGSTLNSAYGQPQQWQQPRVLRFQVKFSF
jgi:hypothetical protein